jgi:hypothetical protein
VNSNKAKVTKLTIVRDIVITLNGETKEISPFLSYYGSQDDNSRA